MNLIWYARAFVYFSLVPDKHGFGGEFNFIRTELGILKPYVSKKERQKNEESLKVTEH